jgi:hypothetical protein
MKSFKYDVMKINQLNGSYFYNRFAGGGGGGQ